ncbi:haloacid dehalogenase, type II [Pseudonocardia sp. CNS-139]|nr:haloacid dehalogenase, type II [Pseudonocardia sp. CNS-139]
MPPPPFQRLAAITVDLLGTTFDWFTGMSEQIRTLAHREGLEIDAPDLTDRWRADFYAALEAVRTGHRPFVPLDVLHAEGLDRILAGRADVGRFTSRTREEMVRMWHRLPAWADVGPGVARLRQRYVVAALSNGGFAQTVNLVKHAGLGFDCVLSAQMAGHYKPDPEVYLTAVDMLDLEPEQILMVAAHGWDLDGARTVGLRTAYVRRPLEKGPFRAPEDAGSIQCDLIVDDFTELADNLP